MLIVTFHKSTTSILLSFFAIFCVHVHPVYTGIESGLGVVLLHLIIPLQGYFSISFLGLDKHLQPHSPLACRWGNKGVMIY